MSRSSPVRGRAISGAVAALLFLPALACAGASLVRRPDQPPPGPPPDVHVGFTVASIQAPGWVGMEHGYAVSTRLEVEVSPFLSPFVEGSLGNLIVDATYYDPWSLGSQVARESRTLGALGVGLKVHSRRRGLFRPTVEAGVSARALDQGTSVRLASTVGSSAFHDDEGETGFTRVGVTMAQPHGAGMFADVGWDFVLRNPADYELFAIRIGVLLP